MPFSRSMQNAVLQAVVLHVANMIVFHHLWSSTEEYFTHNELFYQLGNASEFANNATNSANLAKLANLNGTNLPVAVNATSLSNSTAAVNGTSTTSDKSEESFYKSEFPRNIVIVIVITILEYYWQIWLERILPARARPSTVVPEKISTEDDDGREEEVVKKWIAQGKIRRASLNWCNTAIKWILDITIWQMCTICIDFFLDALLKWKKGSRLIKESNVKMELGLRYVFSFLDSRPLASLIAFVLIPAQKRIVFVAGMQLATSTFFGVFLNTFVPWMLSTTFAKDTVGNISENIRNGTQKPLFDPPTLRLGDEL